MISSSITIMFRCVVIIIRAVSPQQTHIIKIQEQSRQFLLQHVQWQNFSLFNQVSPKDKSNHLTLVMDMDWLLTQVVLLKISKIKINI